MKKRGGKLRQKQGSEEEKVRKAQNKARKKKLASKGSKKSRSKERTRRGKFVDPGNQVCF